MELVVTKATWLFARNAVTGIEARRLRCKQYIEESLALTTALVPRIGYDAAARLAKLAYEEGKTIREIARRESSLSPAELDVLLDPERMTRPQQ